MKNNNLMEKLDESGEIHNLKEYLNEKQRT